MKTLYYVVKIRDIGFMSNEGFIIVKLEKNRIKSIEGILTEDFIIADINNNSILLNYYTREDYIGEYLKEFSIDLDYNDIEIIMFSKKGGANRAFSYFKLIVDK